MPINPDDDISNAVNIARQDIGGGNAIQSRIGGLNQFLSGFDLEANTPQFHTGLNQPSIGGAGFIPHGDPQRNENLATWHQRSHPLLKDENNNPKVLYHGTASDFSKFGKSITGEFGPGIYASDLPEEASGYAGTHSGNQNVMPIHMNLRNPFIANHAHEFWDKFGGENDDEAVYNAMAAGHDGVVYQRPYVIYDPKTKDFINTGIQSTHYIAFSPNQIKSATGNNGQFDPSNPDITKAKGGSIYDDHIAHALRLATGGRAHFDDGGDVRGGDNPGGLSGDTGAYSGNNAGPEQHESLNAFIGREDPQRYTDPESNRLTAEERTPYERTGVTQSNFVPTGLGQALFRDTSGEMTVGQNTRSDVAGPTANQIATEQANQEENRAMAANAAMAQRAGVMTGQSEAPTFTGNTTEEQQLKDAEASQRAAINAAITGANYSAPGTVSAADVATPIQSNIASNAGPFANIANRYTTAATTGAANLGDMARMLERQGAITSATGTPLQSLAAVQPATTTSTNPIDSSEAARNAQFQERVTRNLGEYSGDTIAKINSVFNPNSYYGYTPASQQAAINAVLNSGQPAGQSVIDNTPLEASTLYKAATFEPSQNAALRAARDAITQDMGQPETTPTTAVAQKAAGLGSATPADLPAAKTAPQADTSAVANEAPRIPVNSLEDPALIAAYNAKYNLVGPRNAYADMTLGQRIPNITTNNPIINTVQGANNFLTDLFTPNYKLGSDEYNKISQNAERQPETSFGGHGGGQQQLPIETVAAPVAATPAAAPVVPGTPVPFTYAKRTPYLDYGAYGAGIGNVAPISYRDPINWALVPGYRATGGRVGENNALANAIRLLAMQNRS